MPLKSDAALRKDKTNAYSEMQHRHFATVAAILENMSDDDFEYGLSRGQHEEICRYFATELAKTNHKFDRARFLRACGIEE